MKTSYTFCWLRLRMNEAWPRSNTKDWSKYVAIVLDLRFFTLRLICFRTSYDRKVFCGKTISSNRPLTIKKKKTSPNLFPVLHKETYFFPKNVLECLFSILKWTLRRINKVQNSMPIIIHLANHLRTKICSFKPHSNLPAVFEKWDIIRMSAHVHLNAA